MNLSQKQKEIINTNADKVVVMAAAGSGKTAVLTERVKELLRRGADPSKIVVITFTNAAADEMKERIENPKDCFIGTIHSYANYILSCSGYETRELLDKEQFDELFAKVKEHSDCIREVDYLLLDEAQDSTDEQFEFLLDMIQPKSFFIVGDIRQSIYSFNNANPDYIYDLSRQKDVTYYELLDNYRNAPQILDYAKEFLDPLGYKYYDDSVAKSKEYGQIYRIPYSPEKIGRFILDSNDNFGDWFVLTRTNAQLSLIQETLEEMGIPCESFKKAELGYVGLKEKMKNNTVKVLTIHTSKGLEAKNVIVAGAQYYNGEERRINYVAATRAKKLLVWCTQPQKKRRPKMVSWE